MTKAQTYYILQYSQYGQVHNALYDDVTAIKEAVIDMLDGRGWDNKERVDMRSVRSMAQYLHENLLQIIKTKSFKKYLSYYDY